MEFVLGSGVAGKRCPLCTLPTPSLVGNLDANTAAAIKVDFADWSPTDGACLRCAELYDTRMRSVSYQSSVL